jgi:hypothetical protein
MSKKIRKKRNKARTTDDIVEKLLLSVTSYCTKTSAIDMAITTESNISQESRK